MRGPRVSVVIPTKNGGATLRHVLSAVSEQELEPPPEIVCVDSGSTDGTLDLLEELADRVVHEPPDRFDHGATRNRAVAASRGELVALLVQDAVPANLRWLRELIRPLEEDPTVAGSFARQLPRSDAGALTRLYHTRWLAAREAPRVVEPIDEQALRRLPPSERHTRCAFDNVSSCLRRSVWERHPLRPTRIAEDLAWGREVLLAGHRLAYAAGATVVHSHERGARYELGRTYLAHRRLAELFGLRTVPTARSLARAVAVSLGVHARCLLREHGVRIPPRVLWRGLALAVAWPLGQYLGGRAAATGRDVLHPRGI